MDTYLVSRGFILSLVTNEGTLVYQWATDLLLTAYFNIHFNMIELIYNYDFDEPLYRDTADLLEFHIVLNHAFEEIIN
jgi:hypothetical protein